MAEKFTLVSAVQRAVQDQTTAAAGHATATGLVFVAIRTWLMNGLSVLSLVLTVIATALAIAWYAVTLWETKTVQAWVSRYRHEHKRPKQVIHDLRVKRT